MSYESEREWLIQRMAIRNFVRKYALILIVVALVCALFFVAGCSTLTDQVYTPALSPEAQERCVIVYDHVRWNLAKDGECRGEARI